MKQRRRRLPQRSNVHQRLEHLVAVKLCQRIARQSLELLLLHRQLNQKVPKRRTQLLLQVLLKVNTSSKTNEKRSIGRFFLVLIICFCLGSSAYSQDTAFHVAFYNVENLFDTIDTPDKKDEEFTPSSKLKHGSKNYEIKQTNLAKVINAMSEGRELAVLGLCEVENLKVLQDLRAKLDYKKYDIIHTESPDQRGIDNAMFVSKKHFKILNSGSERIDLGADERPTRDVVWAHLKDKKSKQEFFVFVNHWPSRYGGADASNWKRVKAAEGLCSLMERMTLSNPSAHMIAMGDMNDYPSNESLQMLLKCESGKPCLNNMFTRFEGTERGSHAYKGEWGVLDQILVSKSLVGGMRDFKVTADAGRIFKKKWMLYESSYDGKFYPSRAYGRDKFYGGYSDHLPVLIGITK